MQGVLLTPFAQGCHDAHSSLAWLDTAAGVGSQACRHTPLIIAPTFVSSMCFCRPRTAVMPSYLAHGAQPCLVDIAADVGRPVVLRLSDKSNVTLPGSMDMTAGLTALQRAAAAPVAQVGIKLVKGDPSGVACVAAWTR